MQDPGSFDALSQLENLDRMDFSNVVNGESDSKDPTKNLTVREPLGVHLSKDCGVTWSVPVIYEQKQTGCSDVTSVKPLNCVLYEFGWKDGSSWNLQSICYRSFDAIAICPKYA